MSKFGIFMLGVIAGSAVTMFMGKKGWGNMTDVIEKTKTIDEQLIEAIWKSNPEFVELQMDEKGNVIIDKEKHPNLYDWVVNG